MSIRVKSLTKTYGAQKAVDNVSFTINQGEITGFLGPNGSGKSTTMKCICGILAFDEGTIEVQGHDISEDMMAVKRKVGFLPEHNPLHLDMYVKEYLMHVDGFYNNKTDRQQRVRNIIGLTGLNREAHKKIIQLSKGFRQRVGLAQAMIHNPEVLILDEPTTGLDPNQIVQIRDLISGLAKEKTVLLSTHLLQEVEAICNRVIVISEGRIVADGTSGSIIKDSDKGIQVIYLEFADNINIRMLKNIEGVSEVRMINEKEFLLEGQPQKDLRPVIFRFAADNNLSLLTLQQKEKTLENIFRDLTGNS